MAMFYACAIRSEQQSQFINLSTIESFHRIVEPSSCIPCSVIKTYYSRHRHEQWAVDLTMPLFELQINPILFANLNQSNMCQSFGLTFCKNGQNIKIRSKLCEMF